MTGWLGMEWLRAGGRMRVCCVVAIGLLLGLVGVAAGAQGVTTTNEVRAMRGLGPIKVQGTGIREQGTEQGVRGE